MTNFKTDIVIVGGGIAGLSLACLLAKNDFNIVCIDRADPKKLSAADERTTAISYGSKKILEKAGIWQHLENKTCPIRDIQILDGDSPLLLNFLSHDVEDKSFGWIVENKDLRAALNKETLACKNLKHLAPAQVSDFKIETDKTITILDNEQQIESSLIIGADGRQSFTRTWMDVPVREWNYNQQAIVCIVTHKHPHKNIAVEHFKSGGPFAILPMCDDKNGQHRSSLVFTEHLPPLSPRKRGKRNGADVSRGEESLMNLTDGDFQNLLQNQFPDFYGEIEVISRRLCYPLSLVHAAEYIKPRMALIADAAHGIHPIAGQGLNLGFRDIDTLAELLVEAKLSEQDFGGSNILETYQRKRRPDNMAMVAVTDGLNRLFSNNSKTLSFARKLGLRAVANFPIAKRFFMKQAMADRQILEHK